MSVERIKKRDGRVVPFDRSRIENAISKAFQAAVNERNEYMERSITDDVLHELEINLEDSVPDVEYIQNIVEKKIADRGFFEVSKSYILYRKKRQEYREQSKKRILESLEKGDLKVTTREGVKETFEPDQIIKFIDNLLTGYEHMIDTEEILREIKDYVFDGISTRKINDALVMIFRAKIETEPEFSFLASRVLLNNIYKNVLGVYEFGDNFEELYKEKFRRKIKEGIEQNRFSEKLLEFDFERLSSEMVIGRDGNLRYLGIQTLYDRYLMRNYDQDIIEVPQYFWMRVAMGLAFKEEDPDQKAIDFYNLISELRFVPSTPTLFHSGTPHSQMSSCYLLTCQDELDNIFKSVGDVARLAKWSGGIGIDWTSIRATGAMIKSTNVNSQGVVPFLKILDSTTAAINRSGKRRGATCAYLEVWHYDFEDFLELRKNTGDERRRTHDLNTASWIPDLFMERVLQNKNWTMFSPDEVTDLHDLSGKQFKSRYEEYERMAREGRLRTWKEISALRLWRKMVTMLYETGHPWMTFKDPCNIRSPQDHVGVVKSSNLCTEITLNTSRDEFAVCNLGSVNLPVHVVNGQVDKKMLGETVNLAMRMMDNVIDLNFYPTEEARNSNMSHRPVGLGIMGLQDLFYKLNLNFDSDDAVRLGDELVEFISWNSILSSSKLSMERGTYPSYKGSKWDRGLFPVDTLKILENERDTPLDKELELGGKLNWDEVREHVARHGMRNSNCMAIAPTATIANISGAFPSIEPIYKNLYVKSNLSGEFTIINHYLVSELKKRGFWNDEVRKKIKQNDGSIRQIPGIPEDIRDKYKSAFEIDPFWLVRHAAHRGKWIDQSQSLNIFTDSKSGEFISGIYLKAWKMGLKTTYYLRTLGASAVEKSTLSSVDVAGESCSVGDEGCEVCQ